ncbi:MAG: hypothetical protein ACC613_04215 [Synergistales bacterium]
MRRESGFEKTDSEGFALSLERLFGIGLAGRGVVPYLIRHRLPVPGTLHIEIVLFAASDLPRVEDFIREEFDGLPGRFEPERPSALSDLSPIEATLRLGPTRRNLPEWKGFDDTPFLVTINTLFGEAFRAALARLSGTERAEGLGKSSQELKELYALAQRLDGSFSRLFASFGETRNGFSAAEPASSDESSPAAAGGLSPEEAARFLASRETALKRILMIARENGLSVEEPPPSLPREEGFLGEEDFPAFLEELRILGLDTEEKLGAFFLEKLTGWEDLYAGFESARLRGWLEKRPIPLAGLVSVLIRVNGNA